MTCWPSGAAQGTLYDRGGGLIYDDALHITWLKDANYAATQYATTGGAEGDADGRMNWGAANAWAAGLSYFDSVRNVTWGGWRLPSVNSLGASFAYGFSNNGTTDYSYGKTSPNSEMAYMYYVNLLNLGYCTPDNGNPTSCTEQHGSGSPIQALSTICSPTRTGLVRRTLYLQPTLLGSSSPSMAASASTTITASSILGRFAQAMWLPLEHCQSRCRLPSSGLD